MNKPWLNEPDYKEFEYKGYKCEIKRNISKALCGYVNVPLDSKAGEFLNKNKELDEVLNAHGGITYSEKVNGYLRIGFDCNHYCDYAPGVMDLIKEYKKNSEMTEEDLKKEGIEDPKEFIELSKRLYKSQSNNQPDYYKESNYKDIHFVEKEIKRLADQIIEYEKTKDNNER